MKIDAKYYGTLDLPELNGTDKQVAWATDIRNVRVNLIGSNIASTRDRIMRNRDMFKEKECSEELKTRIAVSSFRPASYMSADDNLEHLELMASYILKGIMYISGADWWIRYMRQPQKILMLKLARVGRDVEENNVETEEKYTYVYPKTTKHDGIVLLEPKVDTNTKRIEVFHEETPHFVELAERLGYVLKTCWLKQISYKQGDIYDRYVEDANAFLNAGYVLKIPSQLKTIVKQNEFKEEQTQWITTQGKSMYVHVEIPKYKVDAWRAVEKIPNVEAKHSKPGNFGIRYAIHIDQFKEIRAFAQKYKYSLSPLAEEKLLKHEHSLLVV